MLQFLIGTLGFWTLIPNYGYLEEETELNDWDSYSNEDACYFDTSEYQESWIPGYDYNENEDSSILVNPHYQPGPFVNLCSQPPSESHLIQNHSYQRKTNANSSYQSQDPWTFSFNPSYQNLPSFSFGSCSTTSQPIQSCHSSFPTQSNCLSNPCCSPMLPPLFSHGCLLQHPFPPIISSQNPLPCLSNPSCLSPQLLPNSPYCSPPLQPLLNHNYSPQQPLNPCCSSPQPSCSLRPNRLFLEPSPLISCCSPSRPPCLSDSCSSSSRIVCRAKPKCQSLVRKCSRYTRKPKRSSHKRRRRTHRKK